MLVRASNVYQSSISGNDGQIGQCTDLLIEDKTWRISDLLVESDAESVQRHTLIATSALEIQDPGPHGRTSFRCLVPLSDRQVRELNCSPLPEPSKASRDDKASLQARSSTQIGYPDIRSVSERPGGAGMHRSMHELGACSVFAKGEVIGSIEDLLLDVVRWRVRYLVARIDTGEDAKHTLLSPHWASQIHWPYAKVHVDYPRDAIRKSPQFRAVRQVTHEYEAQLHNYYSRLKKHPSPSFLGSC